MAEPQPANLEVLPPPSPQGLSDEEVMQPVGLSDAEVMQPPKREGGILQTVPQAIGLLGTEQGRANLFNAIAHYPTHFEQGLLDWFMKPGKAYKEGLTPDEEGEFAFNTALGEVGGTLFKGSNIPSQVGKAIAPTIKEFDAGVMEPAAQRHIAEVESSLRELVKTQPITSVELKPIAEASELGIVGGERPSLNELPPREAGREAMAAVRPDEKITSELPDQTPWRRRWEESLDKMGVTDDARRIITSVVDANDEFVQARQGDMRPVQIEQLAAVTGLDSTMIDVAETSSKIKTDVEMRNTTEAFRIMNDKVRQAATELRDKGAKDNEAEIAKLTQLELQRDLLLEATTSSKELIALRAEFGRTGTRLKELYKAMGEANGVKKFLDESDMTPKDVLNRARLIADTPPEALPKVLKKPPKELTPPSWYYWLYQQLLISGIITHAKYVFVNTATTAMERVIAPEVAAVIGKLRGEQVSLKSPVAAGIGMVQAVPEAFTAAKQAFLTGDRVPLLSELKLAAAGEESPQMKGGAKTPYQTQVKPDWGIWKRVFNEDQLDKAAHVLGMPGRSANAIHTLFKVMSERGAATLRAYEHASKEVGVSGDNFWDRVDYHRANASVEDLKANVTDAYTGAFMNKLGKKTGEWSRMIKNNPVGKWFFPFQHIPLNIERMTFEYSPFAFAGPVMRDSLLGKNGGPAQNLAIAKVVVGSTIMGYFANKYLSGEVTPDYPRDPVQQREWRLMNKQPNSVLMGDRYVSLDRLGPAANLARLGANLAAVAHHFTETKADAPYMEALWASWMAVVNQVGDETGFQTLQTFIRAKENPKEAEKFIARQMSSIIPSLVAQPASAIDPDLRHANTMWDAIKYRLPIARETLMPKRDPIYGQPIANPGYHSLFREGAIENDPVKLEMDKIGYYPDAPHKFIGGVKLTPEQYDKYEATAGPLVKDALGRLIRIPNWDRLGPVAKTELMRTTISAMRQRAAMAMQVDDRQILIDGRQKRLEHIHGMTAQ